MATKFPQLITRPQECNHEESRLDISHRYPFITITVRVTVTSRDEMPNILRKEVSTVRLNVTLMVVVPI